MARNLLKRRARRNEEEGFSLRELTASVSGPIIFFLVIVSVIFVMSVFFRVSDIQVRGNTHYTDEEIIRAIDIEEGDNLFFFDRFAALSRVFAKLPYIDEVSVERSLPNRVIITVSESQALAYIVLGEENWTIDHNCKVLGKRRGARSARGPRPLHPCRARGFFRCEQCRVYAGQQIRRAHRQRQ